LGASDDLTDFVRDALARGQSRASVENVLLSAGWDRAQVHAALEGFADLDFPIPVPRPRPSLSAREAFLYLLQFTTLYLVTFNFGSLLFQFVNRAFPDPVDPPGDMAFRYAVRWAVSMLVVAFPVFLFISRHTSRMLLDKAKRGSAVRRWLTYLTLFAAACVLIGDVVSLIYNVLGGELTIRFTLKVLIVGAIAGTVFGYYLTDLRADEGAQT